MWLVGGPFTSPPLTDCHIGNFGVVQVILLGLNLVAQTFPQAEWAQLLLDARMHSGLWSILLEPVVLQSMVYISATPVLCTRSSSPFCGCLLRGSQWSSWRVEFLCATVRVGGGSSVFWYFPSLNLWLYACCPRSLTFFSFRSSDTWPRKETFLLLQFLWISASSACHFMDSCRWLCVSV